MSFLPSGLSVLTPMGLWALLALAIPVLIHLFNRSRGRLVRIGHIDLIRQARRLRVTEIKLAQWLLLLLRLGIFSLAALILAGLARPGMESSAESTAYVAPAWIRTAQPVQIDELLARHTRVFVLRPEFVALDKAVADEIRQIPLEASGIQNIWPLLAERLSFEHHAGTVEVYATDFLQQFGISRPALPRAVKWNITHPTGTLQLRGLPASVTIAYDEERKQDAEVFRAALTSLKAHRIPGLTWEMMPASQMTPQQLNPDWLIHLSDKDLTAEQLTLINTSTTVLMDASGELRAEDLQYINLPFYPYSIIGLNGLAPTPASARPIMVLASGSPVLTENQAGPARILRFNGRFNPQWSSITQLAEFPELLLHLMLDKHQKTLAFTNARIDSIQLQAEGAAQGPAIPLPRRSLQSLLALLLVLLWITERWLSERKERDTG